MRSLFITFLLFVTCHYSFSKPIEKIDELFILYDYGETQILKDVIEKSLKDKKKIKVITMATAADYFSKSKYTVNIKDIIGTQIGRISWPRDREITQEQVNLLVKKYAPTTVMTGVVSKIQNQIANAYKNNAHVIGVYDSFSRLRQKHITNTFVNEIDEIWIPSTLQIESFRDAGFHQIHAIGHPSVKEWASALYKKDKLKLKELYKLENEKKILTYIGGYGRDYERGLDLFFDSISNRNDVSVIISLHPKSNGVIEKRMKEKYPFLKSIIASKKTSTIDICAISDIVISQNSSAGVQALFQNKDVIYFHLDKHYKNIAINQGLASQLSSKDELKRYLDNYRKKSKSVDLKRLGLVDTRTPKAESCKKALKQIYY